MKKRILLLSFDISHLNHNDRLEKILQEDYQIIRFSTFNSDCSHTHRNKVRTKASAVLSFFSVPMIIVILFLKALRALSLRSESRALILKKAIQGYFNESNNLTGKFLGLNRTLKNQKRIVEYSRMISRLIERENIDCVLFPEDSNFYGAAGIIQEIKPLGISIGIVDYSTGKEAEFKVSGESLLSKKNSLGIEMLANGFLNKSERSRWFEVKDFVDCFPGTLETDFFSSLNPGFHSGVAHFYASPDISECAYLKRQVLSNAVVHHIEPIELTLSKKYTRQVNAKDCFGVFLPPNQLTDPEVLKRMSKFYPTDYDQLIFKILDQVKDVCKFDQRLIVFPHPRIYFSHPELISKISDSFTLSEDYSDYLGRLKTALIFSSAVFLALLSSKVKVFNFDIYGYEYRNVFPEESENFTSIERISQIEFLELSFSEASMAFAQKGTTFTEVLELYL